jgi:hypothetical protein
VLGRIQNGDWDTDADGVSSGNQGSCWVTGDTLGWGKAPGKAETLAPWTTNTWKSSPCHDTLKEQAGHHSHTTANHPLAHQTPHYRPTTPQPHRASTLQANRATLSPGRLMLACQATIPQAHQATAHQLTHQHTSHRPTGLPGCRQLAHQAATQLSHQLMAHQAAACHRRAPAPPDTRSKPA